MRFKSEVLRELVQERGLSFSDVGRLMGGHPSAINGYVNGYRMPTAETLANILRALGWSDDAISRAPIGQFYDIGENGKMSSQ